MTTLQLALWLQKRLVAEISYSPTEEQWSLRYSADWRFDPEAFPLSPALSLKQDISSGAIRRFLENLLPEGHALDIVASSQGIAKSNIFAPYDDAERSMTVAIAEFALAQAERLCDSALEATAIPADTL